MAGVAPSRNAAYSILLRLAQSANRHCDELLRNPEVSALSQADRNLCTNLVMGTLRWQIALDAQIASFLKQPGSTLDPGLAVALRMGAFQLLYLDRIPVHAAVSESVELAKRNGHAHAAGMVNAVLRKVAAAPRRPDTSAPASAAEAADRYAHPHWMVERWARRYGIAKATEICRFDQEQPPTSIRLLHPEAERSLVTEGIELGQGTFLANARWVMRGDVTATDTYRRGAVRIQDEASQLVAEIAGHGSAILDCCAAPGGKTAILAERNPKSTILALDVSQRRLEHMQRVMSFTPGGQISYKVADAARLGYSGQFDLVLCDAPCSGTGTIARNPEIRHRLEAGEFPRQHARQVAILLAAMQALKPGGRLVYATCSLEPEENESVLQDCLSGRPEYRQVSVIERLNQLTAQGALHGAGSALLRDTAIENGWLRTLPGLHPCDGFFAAMAERA